MFICVNTGYLTLQQGALVLRILDQLLSIEVSCLHIIETEAVLKGFFLSVCKNNLCKTKQQSPISCYHEYLLLTVR